MVNQSVNQALAVIHNLHSRKTQRYRTVHDDKQALECDADSHTP